MSIKQPVTQAGGARILRTYFHAVFWDLDGVIVDTDAVHYQSWLAVLPRYGLTMSPEMSRRTIGMNNAKILRMLHGGEVSQATLREIGNAKEAHFRELVTQGLQPMVGVQDWLKQFEAWGFMQAIASSAPMANIMTILNSLDLAKFFKEIISGQDLPAKPDPAIYLEAARRIGVEPMRCIVIEDALVGVEGALAAGMRVIAVTTTFTTAELSRADFVVAGLESLEPKHLSTLAPS